MSPHREIIEKLEKNNITIYRNDLHGTIIATSDGKNIVFETQAMPKQANAPPENNTSSSENTENVVSQKTDPYIGNKNSNIFHIESCSSLPAEHNRLYFDSREDAIKEGQRPCQRCKP